MSLLSTVASRRPALHIVEGRTHRSGASLREERLVALVRAARAGDDAAWTQLVSRFDRPLRTIARSYRLNAADVDDVLQATWLRLFERLGQIREPASVAAWLATTVRRECLRKLQGRVREQLTDAPDLGEGREEEQPDRRILVAERRETLMRALDGLPERHRRLMTALLADPGRDYQQLSRALDMPVGSIGPIRARCLRRLGRDPALRGLHDEASPMSS